MLGLEIFVHSVKMVLRNLKEALQISLVPALIGGAIVIALVFVFGISFEDISTETNGLPDAADPTSVLGFVLCALFVGLAIMLWIVVSWHRFVLLEEYPVGFVPIFRSDRVLAYLGRLLMLIVLGVIAMIPAMFVIGMMAQASAVVGIFVWFVAIIALSVAFYRASPILPAAAIGHSLTLSEAWRATSGASGAITLLVILSLLFQLLLQFLASLLLFVPIIGFLIVIFATMLIVPLINVSILTTIYGIYIEKRELN
ncbi:hypothetical protein [Ruegeria atlantica]|uniref:hypothetical protein n=1 Tax=Ruegeria atlantica TaxID=81569 RepID=UPI00147CBA1E|nr:hypothetical protein [Ruegeria atlantica]